MQTVGYVVGEVRTDEFTFVTNPEIAPPRLEYVVVQGVEERAGDDLRRVDVLGQVTSLEVSSRLLSTAMTYSEVQAILNRLSAAQPIMIGRAKVVGYLDGNVVRYPRGAAMPGSEVELAPDDLLRQFFSRNVSSGLPLGTLINRPGVEVLLDPNGLRRHLAVIAQTGAGKSYTVGVILEKLLELGGTIIVFDPNSDYVLMRRDERQRRTPFAERVEVYRLPTEQKARISDEEVGGARKFTVQFSRLDPDELCAMTGISEKATNIRKAIRTAYDNLQGQDYTPEVFLQELTRLSEGGQAPLAGPRARPAKAAGLAPQKRRDFAPSARPSAMRRPSTRTSGRRPPARPGWTQMTRSPCPDGQDGHATRQMKWLRRRESVQARQKRTWTRGSPGGRAPRPNRRSQSRRGSRKRPSPRTWLPAPDELSSTSSAWPGWASGASRTCP